MKKERPKELPAWRRVGAMVCTRVLQTVCVVAPIAAGIRVNLAAAGYHDDGSTEAAILFVALGCSCFHLLLHKRGVAAKALFGGLALLFLVLNYQNAVSNFARSADSLRNSLQQGQETVSDTKDQLSETIANREAAKKAAGDWTESTANSALAEQRVNRFWKTTQECTVVTGKSDAPQRKFCTGYRELEGKRDSAHTYADYSDKVNKLRDDKKGMKAPGSADPFADAMARTLAKFGYPGTDKESISEFKVQSFAFGLEVGVEVGPTVLLAILGMFLGSGREPKMVVPPAKRATKAPAEPAETVEDDLGRFIADRIEPVTGSCVEATPLYRAWEAWCKGEGIVPGTQTSFGRKAKGRLTQAEKGKPRYLNVQLKAVEAPKLRVVSN